jgi:hypothetical protein
MTKSEIMSILQSDMKLWDSAATTDMGDGTLIKTLDLPFGLGETTITLEGLTNGLKRRSAVEQYGGYIRGLIEECINDEAITARAQQAAAKTSEDTSPIYVGHEADRPERAEVPREEAVSSYGQALIPSRENTDSRIDEIERFIRSSEAEISLCRRELLALQAYREAMYAPEIQASENSESGGTDETTAFAATL